MGFHWVEGRGLCAGLVKCVLSSVTEDSRGQFPKSIRTRVSGARDRTRAPNVTNRDLPQGQSHLALGPHILALFFSQFI